MMEAATLQNNKKNSVNKAKLKKTMKNVLFRPDPIFWPVVSDVHRKELENVIKQYKILVPEFKKYHWTELKDIPKKDRPKAPTTQKVDGLMFGISFITRSISSGLCAAVILEGNINPKVLVQHLLEACLISETPVICMRELKKLSNLYFGITTSCLAVKKDVKSVEALKNKIIQLSKHYAKEENNVEKVVTNDKSVNTDVEMELVEKDQNEKPKEFTYLYRTSKKTRVFTPPSDDILTKEAGGFVGQNFIEFSKTLPKKKHKKDSNKHSYRKMIVKRITNNPNRIKK